jgi:hypothetical protein
VLNLYSGHHWWLHQVFIQTNKIIMNATTAAVDLAKFIIKFDMVDGHTFNFHSSVHLVLGLLAFFSLQQALFPNML